MYVCDIHVLPYRKEPSLEFKFCHFGNGESANYKYVGLAGQPM